MAAMPDHTPTPAPLTYTVKEAAALLGISEWSYRKAIGTGEVPGRRVGQRIIVPRQQLHQWLEQQQ